MMVPQFLRAFGDGSNELPLQGKKLVVIQLSGGNDGLNTVIPYRNDIYYSQRPAIGIKRDAAGALTDEVGLHPALKNFRSFYDGGMLSIVNGVGYPDPNRSHFRSMDIWQSGSTSRSIVPTGWIGRYMDEHAGTAPALAIEVDDTLSLAMKGDERSGIAVGNIKQFHSAAANSYVKKMAGHAAEHDEHLAGYLYNTLRQTASSADYIFDQSKKYTTTQNYPDTALGKRMKTIGTLLSSRASTSVYYVSHGSFDTHVGQKDRQERLLAQLDDAVGALVAELKANGVMNDVLIMTFSEFGRRVAQNGSNGTDHGTASCMFLISGGLQQQGLYNPIPSLADLDEGDLRYSVDFKQVYATILDKWLQADAEKILDRHYKQLPILG